MSSLKNLAVRGAVWVVVGYGASQVVRLISNLILTRLLVPEMFGLMALIQAFIVGLIQFSDAGIGLSIVQNKRGDEPAFLNTAWTIQILRGLLLWLICLAIAWPVAEFYANDKLLWLLPLIGLKTIFDGLVSTAIYTLRRRIALGKVTIIELGAQIISSSIMIIWAFISPTIWALVCGALLLSIVQMIWSFYLIPEYSNRLNWDKTAVKELVSFGKWVFIATGMSFMAAQADKFILGKILTLEMLGIYAINFMLASIPQVLTGVISWKLIYPVVAKLLDRPRSSLREVILQKRRLALLVIAPLLTLIIGYGDIIIWWLYDERYSSGSWMFSLLILGFWPFFLSQTLDPILYGLGKTVYSASGNFFVLLFLLIGIPFAYSIMGITGAVIIISFRFIAYYIFISYGLYKEGLTAIKQDFFATLYFLALLFIVFFVRETIGFGNPFSTMP